MDIVCVVYNLFSDYFLYDTAVLVLSPKGVALKYKLIKISQSTRMYIEVYAPMYTPGYL